MHQVVSRVLATADELRAFVPHGETLFATGDIAILIALAGNRATSRAMGRARWRTIAKRAAASLPSR